MQWLIENNVFSNQCSAEWYGGWWEEERLTADELKVASGCRRGRVSPITAVTGRRA